MKTYALALLAGAAAATSIDSWPPAQQPWNQKAPAAPWAAKPTNAWGAKPAAPWAAKPQVAYRPQAHGYQHQSHGHGSAYQHKPAAHGHGYPAPQQSYSNPHHHAHNPYTPWNTKKPDGWWSAHQQYAPPKIPYVPAKLIKPAYAVCTLDTAATETIVVKIGQMPGHPASIMGSYTGGTSKTLVFTLNQYGDITPDADGNICANVGKVFNPLQELVYNVPNPYSDPSRGTIANVDIPASLDPDPLVFTQAKLLQNLGGKNSITAKSIVVADSTAPDTPIGCCVIGDAAPPVDANSNAGYAHNHNHPHQKSYGYPSYGAPQAYGGYGAPTFGGYGGYGAPQRHPHVPHGHVDNRGSTVNPQHGYGAAKKGGHANQHGHHPQSQHHGHQAKAFGIPTQGYGRGY